MSRKRIILMLLAALLVAFAAGAFYSYLMHGRLEREGVEARAVVTRVYSREETRTRRGTARRPRYEKTTVHYLDCRFTVDGRDYEDRIRRYGNLMTARMGDSLLVRYLPDDPAVHRFVRDDEGNYRITRPVRARSAVKRSRR